MAPGAALGLAFAYVSGQRAMYRWMPAMGLVTAVLIGQGGQMSYGILHGYAKADTLVNYAYGFFTLFLQGGAWGVFGCAAVGLLLERKQVREIEWIGAIITTAASGWLFYYLVVTLIGFDINPPRSNLSIAFTGGAIGLFVWLAVNKKPSGLTGALLGYVGFGMGMAGGRFLGNASYHLPWDVNHWNIMELSCGFIGGFVFTLGMLKRRFPEPPAGYRLLGVYGIVLCMGLIPVWHRLERVDADRMEQWAENAVTLGYEDGGRFAQMTSMGIDLLCVLGCVAGVVWAVRFLHARHRPAALPVLVFVGLMLLIENVYSLYFFLPSRENFIEMRIVWWSLYGLMIVYALLAAKRSSVGRDEPVGEEAESESVPWKTWVSVGLVGYLLILVGSAFVNGEKTMQSANTRFPLWSWRDGPPSE